ncbi:MAG: hypothetical protein PHQ54_02500, partial [Candidatus Omnitrophica bacterium]|nr:hypothetical protein [Candidatus Omnitrophota bacterium]
MDTGLLLISGLDSILAGMLLKEQNVSFKVIYFHIPFCSCRPGQSCKITEQLSDTTRRLFSQELNVVEVGREFMELVKNSKHGFGKNINPCIDCKIFMFKRAKLLLKDYDARYVITGEVLGERPMSQNRRALDLIEQESGLKGFMLRPLSAKLLPLS